VPNSTAADFEFVKRHDVLTYPEYWFELDEYRRGEDQMILAHIRFVKFTPSIFKRVLREWKTFREVVTCPLFAFGEQQDEKWERFVTLLGFKPLHTDVVWEGKSRRLFLHAKGFSCDHDFFHTRTKI
jgi:hypothetical protein